MPKTRKYVYKTRQPAAPSPTQPTWLRLDEAEKQRVDALAERFHKTRAAMLRYLVLKGMEAVDEDK